MAWNEPGGEKDPWGKKNDQGPPDLDEVFKNIQSKLSGLFGGSKTPSSGSSGGGFNFSGTAIGFIVAIVVIVWLGSGIYIIQPAERGVITRFGEYQASTLPGPHWHIPWPVEKLWRVNVDQNRSLRLRSQSMLTQDENIVEIDIAIQYNIKNPEDYLFKVRDPDATLQQVMESAIREIIGKNNMDFIITEGRNEIATRTEALIQATLDEYGTGLNVTTVNLESAQPPEAVQAAFSDAIKAREDEQRFINESEAYANEIIPQARGEARSILEEAKGYRARVVKASEGESIRFLNLLREYEKAPQVTRERLYIDSLEGVLVNSSKVLLDVEGGNNIMYLPLDQLLGSARSSLTPNSSPFSSGSSDSSSSNGSSSLRQSVDSLTNSLRSRSRETR